MAKQRTKITWTDKQKEIAELVQKGKTRHELLSSGYKSAVVDRVIRALKEEGRIVNTTGDPNNPPSNPPGNPPPKPPADTRIKPRYLDLVQVGSVLIEPYDWRINQYGVFLILDTYERAKQGFNYGGTLGEFLCDCAQLCRLAMRLDIKPPDYFIKEGDNGAGLRTNEEQGDRLDNRGSPEEGGTVDGGPEAA